MKLESWQIGQAGQPQSIRATKIEMLPIQLESVAVLIQMKLMRVTRARKRESASSKMWYLIPGATSRHIDVSNM
jgi:hypothetical protein